MHAMVLKKLGAALEWTDLADRQPGPGEIRVKAAAYSVNGELLDTKVSRVTNKADLKCRLLYTTLTIGRVLSEVCQ
jgi:NADPH:quinone reductase-like Zn-dependent oxidoreductase